jgi:hypothetical protein
MGKISKSDAAASAAHHRAWERKHAGDANQALRDGDGESVTLHLERANTQGGRAALEEAYARGEIDDYNL